MLMTYLLCLSPKITYYCLLDMNIRHKNLTFTFDFEQNNNFLIWMLRLLVEVKDFLLQFFVKSHLVQFSRTLIILLLSLINRSDFCITVSLFDSLLR